MSHGDKIQGVANLSRDIRLGAAGSVAGPEYIARTCCWSHMAIVGSRDHFFNMSKAFVARESARMAEVVKGLLHEHYPNHPLELQAGDEAGPHSESDRPGPPMLRLIYHSLTSEDLQLRDDGLDFDRLQSLYQLSVIAHMMTLKEARDEASASELLSRQGKKAADARHAENREIAQEIKDWYAANHHRYKSMDAAAAAVTKLQPVVFSTARKHIGTAAKGLGLRK